MPVKKHSVEQARQAPCARQLRSLRRKRLPAASPTRSFSTNCRSKSGPVFALSQPCSALTEDRAEVRFPGVAILS